MMRRKQRKSVEELYGSKFEAAKSHSAQKTGRIIERDNGLIISTTTPASNGAADQKSLNADRETARRKSDRSSNKNLNEKHCVKEPAIANEGRRSPVHLTQHEKFAGYVNKTGGHLKELANNDTLQHKHHQHQHHHQNQNHNQLLQVRDEDKDDDTDEFFELIRRTVESAIGKSISELLNRNFRELSSKVERFSGELTNTNSLIKQLHNEMTNKIGHYGEENSRQFRYLCMKSEYDKMFYQHQNFIASTKLTNEETPTTSRKPKTRNRPSKLKKSTTKLQDQENNTTTKTDSCSCPSKTCNSPTPVSECRRSQANSSANVSQKTSEIGMRSVLEHIQKFCAQMQFNDLKCVTGCEDPTTSRQPQNVMRTDNFIQVNREAFVDENDTEADEEDEEDADEWDLSSDGMTPRNKLNDSSNQYGGSTSRGSIASRGGTTHRGNNGAGDG